MKKGKLLNQAESKRAHQKLETNCEPFLSFYLWVDVPAPRINVTLFATEVQCHVVWLCLSGVIYIQWLDGGMNLVPMVGDLPTQLMSPPSHSARKRDVGGSVVAVPL